MLGLLVVLDRRWVRWGESFLAFGLGYCVVRFLIEWLRADSASLVYGLTFSQVASIGCTGVCAAVWMARCRLAARGHTGLYRGRLAVGELESVTMEPR